jgi:hypothetical protein
MRTYHAVPEAPVGAILNPKRGFFSVVIPLARTNLVTNPSFETGTTGWLKYASDGSTSSGAPSRTTDQQYAGAYSAASPAGAAGLGLGYDGVALVSGTAYAVSCRVRSAVPGVAYDIQLRSSGGSLLAARRFVASGRWDWLYLIYQETSSATRRLHVASVSGAAFHLDAVQVESCADGVLSPSTYLDGDQPGLLPNQFPPAYGWNGTPHASTSYRRGSTAAGGYLVNLDRFRFKVLAYAGLGLTTLAHAVIPPAVTDGASYVTTVARPRSFAITGFVDAPGLTSLDQYRGQLLTALGPDRVSPRQPIVLEYQAHDEDTPTSRAGRLVASLDRGGEGLTNGAHQERMTLQFSQWLPGITAGDAGAALTERISVADADYITRRSPAGLWSALGTGGMGGRLAAIAVGPDGSVYAGGEFTSMGGVADTAKIAKWDPTTSAWSALGTGAAGGHVYALAVGADGSLYAAGTFTSMGGVANTSRIAKWNGSAWSALDVGANNSVTALALSPAGVLYAGGNFTSIGGVAIDRIAQWNGSAWSALHATGANNTVTSLVVAADGTVYAGGAFTSIGGVSAARVAAWDGTSYTALGAGFGDTVQALTIGSRGELYAGGNFTGDIDYIGVWNGAGWQQLGVLDNNVFSLHVGPDRILRAGGAFVTADGITLNDGFATWNGSGWVQPDIAFPGLATVYAIASALDGTIYIGHDNTSTASAAGITTVTNTGTARSYPTLTIAASQDAGLMYQLLNLTNGRAIYLALAMNAGERIVLRSSAQGTTIYSSFRGDVSSAILPGSAPDFSLEPGQNSISLFLLKAETAVLHWPITYQSASDLTER